MACFHAISADVLNDTISSEALYKVQTSLFEDGRLPFWGSDVAKGGGAWPPIFLDGPDLLPPPRFPQSA